MSSPSPRDSPNPRLGPPEPAARTVRTAGPGTGGAAADRVAWGLGREPRYSPRSWGRVPGRWRSRGRRSERGSRLALCCTSTVGAGAPRALRGQERNRERLGLGRLGAGTAAPDWPAGSAGGARAAGGVKATVHLAHYTHGCAGLARAAAPRALPAKGSERLGHGSSPRVWQARASSPPGEGAAEPRGVAQGAWIRAQRKAGRGPHGAGRWPCDVAGVAEFGRVVLGCPVLGAGKLPSASLSPIPRARTLKVADPPARASSRHSRRAVWRGSLHPLGSPACPGQAAPGFGLLESRAWGSHRQT